MRVVYYPFNTNTRLALDSSRSNALSISKRHAEEWWFNFGGEVGGLFFSREKPRFFSQTLNKTTQTHTQTKPHTKEESARASLAGYTTTTRGSLANARGKESVVAANSTRTSKIKRKRSRYQESERKGGEEDKEEDKEEEEEEEKKKRRRRWRRRKKRRRRWRRRKKRRRRRAISQPWIFERREKKEEEKGIKVSFASWSNRETWRTTLRSETKS